MCPLCPENTAVKAVYILEKYPDQKPNQGNIWIQIWTLTLQVGKLWTST